MKQFITLREILDRYSHYNLEQMSLRTVTLFNPTGKIRFIFRLGLNGWALSHWR